MGSENLNDYLMSEVSSLRTQANAAMAQFHEAWWRKSLTLQTQAERDSHIEVLNSVSPFEDEWVNAWRREMAEILRLGHRDSSVAPKTRAAFEALMSALKDSGFGPSHE